MKATRKYFKTPKKGCVFRFGESDKGWGYGIVLESETSLFICIYEPIFKSPEINLNVLEQSSFLLSGWTQDARFYHGNWEKIGTNDHSPNFIFPEFKVVIDGKWWVTDYKSKILRRATKIEEHKLDFHTTRSPIGYENAFWAHHKLGSWMPHYDKLLVSPP